MRVFVYVEGPSDRSALEVLLEPVIRMGRDRGIGIRFLVAGDKAALLRDVGRRGADHLADNPEDWVFALPDLYPMVVYDGTDHAHRSYAELERLLRGRFQRRAEKVGVAPSALGHFQIHCLKHDLETLLLAAPQALRARLRTGDALADRWRIPVEDQNDSRPPKRIVEELFRSYRRKPGYVDTVDAPWILRQASLADVLGACPERFGPFVDQLRALVG